MPRCPANYIPDVYQLVSTDSCMESLKWYFLSLAEIEFRVLGGVSAKLYYNAVDHMLIAQSTV